MTHATFKSESLDFDQHTKRKDVEDTAMWIRPWYYQLKEKSRDVVEEELQ